MALPALIQAIQQRFRGSNNNAYNPSSNPLGLGQGGQRQNFSPRLKDMADLADWMAGATDAVDADATQTAADRVQTGKDVTSTGTARDKAQSWANAPEDQEVEPGKFSAFHFVRKAAAEYLLAKGQADAAAATYDAFDDRYLGAKPADPTSDNDGNALIVGALYFSTSANVMKVYNGAAWQVQVPDAASYVPNTRTVSVGSGLTGGGDLSANRTIGLDFSTQAEAEAGTNTTKPMSALRVKQAIAVLAPTPKFEGALFHARDEKSSGTNGGNISAGAWATRDLNTILTNQIGATLASNAITLPAGTYDIEASCPGVACDRFKSRLWDVSANATILMGTSEFGPSNGGAAGRSVISGRFSLSSSKQLRIEQICSFGSSIGLGNNTGISGVIEVYSNVKIWKVA